jgi:mono/diheme cytochrome c family protein
MFRPIFAVAIAGVIATASAWPTGGTSDPKFRPGWATYDRYCLACHGEAGDGRGPAAPFTWARPRAFTTGEFAWRSTPAGQPPTDDDLRAAIRFGAPGTSMPAFDGVLSPAEIDAVIAIVKAFAPKAFAQPATPIVLSAPAEVPAGDLWTKRGCAACHGDGGRGNGPSAKAMPVPPYDLATQPLRRPRATDDRESRRHAAAMSIATGMSGTAMPGYAGSMPDAEIWALASRVVEIGAKAERRDRSSLDADAIAADRTAKLETGSWPGTGDEAVLFGGPIPPQGQPPASLAPAQASLNAQQCARCHAKQYREWEDSIHHDAGSPGLFAQIDHGMEPAEVASCQRCHAPLAEQRTDLRLRAQGVTCAACHLRNWTRHGPSEIAASLLPIASYPLVTLAIYERGDFCMPCHQLPPRTAVAGRPLLNTYKEWLEGPYMRRGIECQHCHMPNREHTWKGVHDPHAFRQGTKLTASARRDGGAVSVTAELANVGAAHYLPTTPTPAVWLWIELVDARGKGIPGAVAKMRIGRDIYYDTAWHEREDTRIPPGESRTLSHTWQTKDAVAARISVEVHPDDYYEHLYAEQLAGKLAPEQRALYEQAAARARKTHYVSEQRQIPIR